MFNHIIFDFDNTLYDYSYCNDVAMDSIFEYISVSFEIDIDTIKNKFILIRAKYHNNVFHQASSHNKCIQFKKLVEELQLPLENSIRLYDLYIQKFNENLKLYEHVEDFLIFCNTYNISCYLLTNNICYEQLTRLNTLNILKYFKKIYTSEEFGIEKPDIKIFYSVLQENNINKYEVAMIGDSYKHDIACVNLIDIYAFWFNNKELTFNKQYCEFNNFSSLLTFFSEYYNESKNFIELSKFCGERYDLVQAGGGNISFKTNEFLFIKSSGCLLSDINYNKNYVGLDRNYVLNNLNSINCENKKTREVESNKICTDSKYFLKNFKPSIETTMHCITKKYTVHLHPLQFLKICGLDNCEKIINNYFKDACFVNYYTPGIDVAIELKKIYNMEGIIFLKNHGIVITSDNINDIYELLNYTINTLEIIINVDFEEYKLTNYISSLMNNVTSSLTVSYVSNDFKIRELKNNIILDPYFPDKLVYCGIDILKLNNVYDTDIAEIVKYNNLYNELPKLFVYEHNIYINSNSLKKCIEIESMLKCHLLCYNCDNKILTSEENNYLNDWDAEKYRKKI
jgi:HAD superfamily hydrolase (TIGR01549 family)